MTESMPASSSSPESHLGTSQAEPTWGYWCPSEGDHFIHPQELQVGIVSTDDLGRGRALLIASVVPPTLRDGLWHQNEAFARTMRDALMVCPWNDPDGFAAGMYADGVGVPFPRLLPTEGSGEVA